MTYTAGTLLGGRLQYRQTEAGHRSGIEPILLAAAIPAYPGERILEAGTGAGAALLCLGYRVAGIIGVGIERDPDLAWLAAANFGANAMSNVGAITADVTRIPLAGGFDHCFANPPWRSPLDTGSPDPARRRAHRASMGLLGTWASALAAQLKPRGSLTFIVPAASLDECIIGMRQADCASCRILPLWPRAGRPAKLVIIQSRKRARGPAALLSGLVLHAASGYTCDTESILRDGDGLAVSA